MSRQYFKTKGGTDLPILALKGKEYLEVKYRLVWFNEEKPDWSIETDAVSVTDSSAYFKAIIKDESGRIRATAHKFENRQGFADFIEKAETGAIGRALALIGYGTQFCADELDEGKRIVDAPIETQSNLGQQKAQALRAAMAPSKPNDDLDPVIQIGRKYRGKRMSEVPLNHLKDYCAWLEENAQKKGVNLDEATLEFLEDAYRFMNVEGTAV